DLALALAEHGLRDTHLVEVLQDRARQTGRPPETARLLRAAVRAGAGGPDLELRLADALARSGDCTAAAAVTDTLLGTDGAHRSAAVRIAASVATHDGNTGHAADLFEWLAADGIAPGPETCAAGVIVLVGAGEPGPARELAARPGVGPPTSTARAARSLADGILMTLDQPYQQAASRLGQALGPAAAPDAAMPDSAAALATLAALHAGDVVRARAVIGRAVESTADGAFGGVFGPRHRLLRAWLRMQDGQLTAAAHDLEAVAAAGPLHRRDSLWATTLRAALARRTGDTGALLQHWFGAMEDLAEYSVDLYSLLPLGELWICAERLHQTDRIHYAVDQGFAVLRALGDPPAWSLPLHWAGVHAAILAGSPAAMAPHGQALANAAADTGFAAILAAAGRSWLRVLARQVDPDDVGAAARGLATCGLTWDATRLAGQAALQADDARISGAMLQIARDLKLATDVPEEPGHAAAAGAKSPPPGPSPLSEREREVAELLLLGMPYRDIGAQLFISAKTVEHHVARIRRRLGAESRSEMLSMLRAILTPQDAAPPS
ncbi:MAG: isoniazid response ATPase/transcriptional regulator IniR, partial [Mycobacterium sp.]